MSDPRTIYTVGYSGWTPEQLKQKVEELEAWLLDIRFNPTSRLPQWREAALATLLGRQRYWHCKSLGNSNYRSGGDIRLVNPGLAANLIKEILSKRSIILMCGCRDVNSCHRKVAAEFLSTALGSSVVHLEPPAEQPDTLPAISLWQPHATLMALDEKRYETRSWWTKHRGPIAIHATKRFPPEAVALCFRPPFREVLYAAGYHKPADLPLGAILAVVNLVDCVRTDGLLAPFPGEQELAFGNWSPGRWAWKTEFIHRFEEPIPARGYQQLWPVPADLMPQISQALATFHGEQAGR